MFYAMHTRSCELHVCPLKLESSQHGKSMTDKLADFSLSLDNSALAPPTVRRYQRCRGLLQRLLQHIVHIN